MLQKTALENSKSGFSDDENSLSNMNVKNMEKNESKKHVYKFTLFYIM